MTADKHLPRMPPRIKTDFNRWVNSRNQLKEHWEHPASVLCDHCGEPIELAWSSSAVGQKLIHGRCWPEWKRKQPKEGNIMSTIEDFENAPVGATAILNGSVQVWKEIETGMYPWWDPFNYKWLSNGELVEKGFTLDRVARTDLAAADLQLQALTLWTVTDLVEALAHGRVHIAPGHDPALTAPTSAQEALDLAWNLAYPVKEGQRMPSDTQYLLRHGLGYNLRVSLVALSIDSIGAEIIRTLDPLPDPEPVWLDAPAVIAVHETHYSVPSVWVPHLHQKRDWTNAITGKTFPWQDLTDVTPLYPEGKKE